MQIAVNSEYITGIDVFSDRTDFGTLVPFLKTLQREHGKKYNSVTADAKNNLYNRPDLRYSPSWWKI